MGPYTERDSHVVYDGSEDESNISEDNEDRIRKDVDVNIQTVDVVNHHEGEDAPGERHSDDGLRNRERQLSGSSGRQDGDVLDRDRGQLVIVCRNQDRSGRETRTHAAASNVCNGDAAPSNGAEGAGKIKQKHGNRYMTEGSDDNEQDLRQCSQCKFPKEKWVRVLLVILSSLIRGVRITGISWKATTVAVIRTMMSTAGILKVTSIMKLMGHRENVEVTNVCEIKSAKCMAARVAKSMATGIRTKICLILPIATK